jgi:hypothetical protein
MAKGGGSSGSGSGLSTGLGLVGGAVSVNTCPIENQTFFCQFSRIFQMITWVFSILVFLYIGYIFLSVYVFSKRGRSRIF